MRPITSRLIASTSIAGAWGCGAARGAGAASGVAAGAAGRRKSSAATATWRLGGAIASAPDAPARRVPAGAAKASGARGADRCRGATAPDVEPGRSGAGAAAAPRRTANARTDSRADAVRRPVPNRSAALSAGGSGAERGNRRGEAGADAGASLARASACKAAPGPLRSGDGAEAARITAGRGAIFSPLGGAWTGHRARVLPAVGARAARGCPGDRGEGACPARTGGGQSR